MFFRRDGVGVLFVFRDKDSFVLVLGCYSGLGFGTFGFVVFVIVFVIRS